jgi:hypothetical protein
MDRPAELQIEPGIFLRPGIESEQRDGRLIPGTACPPAPFNSWRPGGQADPAQE